MPSATTDPKAAPLPFTILTGWLGTGKTTTLNRLLSAPHGKRIAVLVNELGKIAIDTKLILRRGGDILELAGGCLCCKLDIRNDLWDGIADIVSRTRPDYLVLETTGIAEPLAIIEGLARVRADVRDAITVAGIISVVDAEVGAQTGVTREEARAQLHASDRVLMTKLDRATASLLGATRAMVQHEAPAAEIASFPNDDAGAMNLCHWLLASRPLATPVAQLLQHGAPAHANGDAQSPQHHRHRHGQLHAMAFHDPAPLVAEHVLEILRGLGDTLARAKGFIHVAGAPRMGFLEKAGAVLGIAYADDAVPTPGTSEFVLIGDFDDAAVLRQLYACRAGATASP